MPIPRIPYGRVSAYWGGRELQRSWLVSATCDSSETRLGPCKQTLRFSVASPLLVPSTAFGPQTHAALWQFCGASPNEPWHEREVRGDRAEK